MSQSKKREGWRELAFGPSLGPEREERDTLIGPSVLSHLVPEHSLLSPVGAPGGGMAEGVDNAGSQEP